MLLVQWADFIQYLQFTLVDVRHRYVGFTAKEESKRVWATRLRAPYSKQESLITFEV